MKRFSKATLGGLMSAAAMFWAMAPAAAQEVPEGYPADYAEVIAAAREEGKLTVYSSTDSANVVKLMDGFRARYPGITIDYLDLSSNDVYTRISSEQAAGAATADLAWAGASTISSMVEAGLAETYVTPEAAALLPGATWQDQAFSITIEPVVLVYNRRLVDETALPTTHAELTAWLEDGMEPAQFATYDPARSAAGVAYGMFDEQQGAEAYWALIRAIGAADSLLYSSTSTMVEKVSSGEHSVAYNLGGSTAAKAVMDNPDALGMVKFCDYSGQLVRAMMIPEAAAHKNTARLFLDYALSREGQVLLTQTPFGTVRTDVDSEEIMAMPRGCEAGLKLMALGEDALRAFDEDVRTAFLAKWQSTFDGN